jgi:Zn-dependent peptidase ImmA (M78 family)
VGEQIGSSWHKAGEDMRKAKSVEIIRQYARDLLQKCRITTLPIPVEMVARTLKAQIRYQPFDGELAGMLVRGADGETVIGVNSLHHTNRQRFTIAHECGHLLFHKGKDVHIDRTFRINKRDSVSSQAIDPDEIEANRFAAELLMPIDLVLEDLGQAEFDVENDEDLKALAAKYQVSVQAMTHRVTNLLPGLF